MFGRTAAGSPTRPRSWRRRLVLLALALLVLVVVLGWRLTDAAPLVPAQAPPSPEQVGAVRTAASQFLTAPARRGGEVVQADRFAIRALGAMASDALAPDRVRLETRGGRVFASISRELPLGRWLNVSLVSRSSGAGFPPTSITIGSVTFSERASRWLLQIGRRVAILRGIEVPPLDRLARQVVVRANQVSARVTLPGTVAPAADDGSRVSPKLVVDAYCRLVKLQAARPSDDFAIHVRRAFARSNPGAAASPTASRAAFVALAMVLVDTRIGMLADVDPGTIAKCPAKSVEVQLNGRADLPKHWALSAALAATTGVQFSQMMGEWKELADSIDPASQFAVGDPSGFSFLDLAADRAGSLFAGAAIDPASATRAADTLARIEQEDLLPAALMGLPEGLSEAEFARRFGDTKDPRFVAALGRIDAELRRSSARRGGVLGSPP